MKKKSLAILFAPILFFGYFVLSGSDGFLRLHTSVIPMASAEDDEEEYEAEEEDEDDDDDDRDSDSSDGSGSKGSVVKTKQVTQEVVEYKPVTKTVTVTDEAYKIDSDGDLLVDALDPSPFIKQSEYFTDIDGDSIPNALDKHHDEDDFAYFDGYETDTNDNGILDSYEQ